MPNMNYTALYPLQPFQKNNWEDQLLLEQAPEATIYILKAALIIARSILTSKEPIVQGTLKVYNKCSI